MPLHEIALLTAVSVGAVVLATAVGIGVYLFGSFFLMRAHTSPREFPLSLREFAREAFLASLTQPLLPLYYMLGRKLAGGSGVPIVMVHGYMHNRVGFVGLARALGRRGLGPIYGINYPWFVSVESNALRLERFVARICEETGQPKVDLVCHSMGGLVAIEMMRDEAKQADLKVRKVVTIATPHAGVAWKGPIFGIGAGDLRAGSKLLLAQAQSKLVVPVLSIYSTHDNIVHPAAVAQLALRGGRDIEVEGPAHLSILFSKAVADHVATFLAEPNPV